MTSESLRGRASGFGHVDKLPSRRWRARYTGPDGKRRTATFRTKADARAWLATAQADLVRKVWRAPEAGRRTVGAYAAEYLARTDLRASTRALYAGLWRLHLTTRWALVPVAGVTPQLVRAWYDAAASTTGPTALAQSYRLLRAVLQVAVSDEAIASNPCRLRGAATPKPARPARALTAAEIHTLAAAVPARYSGLILTLAFGGLRFGEATALRRRDVTPDGVLVTVERSVRYLQGEWVLGPPKSEAGRRTIALPEFVAAEIVGHLDAHVEADAEALVFGTRSGHFLNGANFGSTFRGAVGRCGLPPVRVHELRHTGATLAAATAATGASTAELMRRFGHASPDAALVYQHAAADRDAEIARALDTLARGADVVPIRRGSGAPRGRTAP